MKSELQSAMPSEFGSRGPTALFVDSISVHLCPYYLDEIPLSSYPGISSLGFPISNT